MARTGDIIDGKYEILKEIGRGGMSVVYLAMDRRLNKQWAVKEIRRRGNTEGDQIIINSLMAEANLMKRLDHPAIPRIVDIIEERLTIFIVMDYIEGESLDKVLAAYGPQPEQCVIDWARQLCDVLSYLHRQKPPVIYRDMKPGNVILKPEGNIKIIDFGTAGNIGERRAGRASLGTRGYSPPEQYEGRTDERTDIYALGVTMHQLLTGSDPQSGRECPPVRMLRPDLSEGIGRIVSKCVQTLPENRYQSCADLAGDLEHPEVLTEAYRSRVRRKVRTFLAAVCTAAVCIAGGILCRAYGTHLKNSTYEAYLSRPSATSVSERVEACRSAIALYPGRPEAYIRMLEIFEDEGHFGKKENDEFLALYNANKDKFDRSGVPLAELNYKAGLMYFNYYSDENESFSSRVQKAYSFFAENHDHISYLSDFSYARLSGCYYQICYFYKKYILRSSSVDEASETDYEKLLRMAGDMLAEVQKIPEANSYDKIAACSGIFSLLYDQRTELAQAGIDRGKTLSLLEETCRQARMLKVNKEQTRRLQAEITKGYAGCAEAIQRAYDNYYARNALRRNKDL